MDRTIIKVDSSHSPVGTMGQIHLASGKSVSMRLWAHLEPGEKPPHKTIREYETVGYVIDGEATLVLEDEEIVLRAGDSWVVPKGVEHSYSIRESFTAVEATSPPSQVHGREERGERPM